MTSPTEKNTQKQNSKKSEEDLNLSIENLYKSIEQELLRLGYSYQKPALLAKAILQSSDYFIERKGASPWLNKDFTASYIAHFLPMNIFRWLKVFDRLENLNFENLNNFFDFGAGPLTFRIAHLIYFERPNISYSFNEPFPEASKIGEHIYKNLAAEIKSINSLNENSGSHDLDLIDEQTLILSYALNELQAVPENFWSFKNIVILEPSTQKLSRQLLEFREKAKQYDFSPIAPCTHCDKCPLLFESKKDWCFDRTRINIPTLAQMLYKVLPFDTSNLSFSYLWVSKERPENNSASFRVVGDWQKEKGKKKIMICRSSDREFLSLLKKDKDFNKDLSRGDQDILNFPYEIKGNELRIK